MLTQKIVMGLFVFGEALHNAVTKATLSLQIRFCQDLPKCHMKHLSSIVLGK